MAVFRYTAKNASGNRLTKTMEASSREEVMETLKREGLQIISVEEGGKGKKAKGPKQSIFSLQLGKVKPKVSGEMLVIFTRQFSTMIGAGIPVLECLDILEEQTEDPGFKICLQEVVEDIRGGSDLSQALSKHPRVFVRIYVNMIKAGEASGQLDTILQRLAGYMEATEKLKREIKGAMTYPVISLTMILGITSFLLIFIIPKFESIFTALGVELPGVTLFVLGLSKFLVTYYLQIGIGMAALVVFLKWWKKTESGNYLWDKMMLKLPVFGDLLQKVSISRFAKTFSTLLKSGVPVLGALEIVSATAGNRVLEEAVDNARESIRQGETLAKPLGESWVFPPMVVRMISVGERTGALEQLLEKISEFYDDQVSATVDALTSLIEPLMIGVMGIIVGGIVLAVFLPIFKMQEAVTKK
jgi:type IV pilus assembly protein PilC